MAHTHKNQTVSSRRGVCAPHKIGYLSLRFRAEEFCPRQILQNREPQRTRGAQRSAKWRRCLNTSVPSVV
jgi:hypothetical protein